MRKDMGVPASPSGCQPTASAASASSPKASIPNATSRRIRQGILVTLLGPVIGLVTVFSWFTVWPFIALMDALHGEQSGDLWNDSLGLLDEFAASVRNVK